MNKDNAKQFLPLVQALADGKVIQTNNGTLDNPNWETCEDWFLTRPPEQYRIKPEPRRVWVNEYLGGFAVFEAEDQAKRAAGPHAKRIAVEYVEVV